MVYGIDHIEILVLDDGSDNSSVNVLQELSRRSPFPMKVMVQENTGNIGKNINRIIKMLK
jgi:alpha-1,3-rhamnosyltransferase